jgi:hypothetical protein
VGKRRSPKNFVKPRAAAISVSSSERRRISVRASLSLRLAQFVCAVGSPIFRSCPSTRSLEYEANDITRDIDGLNVENVMDGDLLQQLRASFEEEDAPAVGERKALWANGEAKPRGEIEIIQMEAPASDYDVTQ